MAPDIEDYAGLTVQTTTVLYGAVGLVGTLLYAVIFVLYFRYPSIQAQHPAAHLMFWHVGCAFMLSIGFVVTLFLSVRLVIKAGTIPTLVDIEFTVQIPQIFRRTIFKRVPVHVFLQSGVLISIVSQRLVNHCSFLSLPALSGIYCCHLISLLPCTIRGLQLA